MVSALAVLSLVLECWRQRFGVGSKLSTSVLVANTPLGKASSAPSKKHNLSEFRSPFCSIGQLEDRVAMQSDSDLLHEYIQTGSQDAFTELVNRHANWVFAAALRLVRDTHLAEDVTQAVFLILSQKAKVAQGKHSLAGWLLKVVRFSATNAMRSRARRERHERCAAMQVKEVTDPDASSQWDELAARLDKSVLSLRSKDREAVLLRFYQRLSLADVGQTLGISEDAAKKRVAKAVGALRPKLGVSVSTFAALALATALLERSSQAAPPSLIAKCVTSANSGIQIHMIAKGAMKLMFRAKMKIVALALFLTLTATTAVHVLLPTAKADPSGNKEANVATTPTANAAPSSADSQAVRILPQPVSPQRLTPSDWAAIQRWLGLVKLRHEVLMFDVPPGTVLFRQKASDTEQSLLQLLRGARYVGTVKDRMAGRLFPTPRVDPGDPWTVLLHERWTPAGKHRVVLVEANVMLSAQDVYLDLSVQLFGAGSIPHPIFTVLIIHPADGVHVQGEIPGFPGVLASVARVHYGSDFELLAGRPDPLDPSAFLFDLRNGEKTITIRGRIRDDDALTLSTSDGSLLPLTVASTMKPIN